MRIRFLIPLFPLAAILSAAVCPFAASALPVKSGNTLALDFVSADQAGRGKITKNATGKIYFFRYLRIVDFEEGRTNGCPCVRISAVEPSSDMRVNFMVTKRVSLKKLKEQGIKLETGIAVNGRIQSMGKKPNAIVLHPAIVRHKDRLTPKIGKELLYEVDPEARMGTDTSSGKERVIKGQTNIP